MPTVLATDMQVVGRNVCGGWLRVDFNLRDHARVSWELPFQDDQGYLDDCLFSVFPRALYRFRVVALNEHRSHTSHMKQGFLIVLVSAKRVP